MQMNLGGAKDRVALGEVWEDVQAMLNEKGKGPRASYTKQSLFAGVRQCVLGWMMQ